jgi:hypothetical protein
MESPSNAYVCRVKGCSHYFHGLGQLKEHQAVQHRQFPCAYSGCSISCRRKYDLRRHHKNQHDFYKEACSHGCGYIQRRDKMRNHLKECHFGKGISYSHSTNSADAMKEQNMNPAPESTIPSILIIKSMPCMEALGLLNLSAFLAAVTVNMGQLWRLPLLCYSRIRSWTLKVLYGN